MVKECIKVYLRLKPNLPSEKGKPKRTTYEVDEDSEGHPRVSFEVPKQSLQEGGLVNNKKENYKFRFDKIFDNQSLQDEVFETVAKPVINNVLSGYNGTIFAYGQTGSGKTYSIVGDCSYNDRGIIPRTLAYIFEYFDQHPDCEFSMAESYLEIYNEKGYDLFDTSRDSCKLEDLRRVNLFEDSSGGMHLRNLSVHSVNSYEEALPLFLTGDTNRMMAETVMNKVSTRSHCIFTIHVTSRQQGSATVRRAKLHLVDLAGSERPSKTGTNGQLLMEAKFINKSLHHLEQVIVALSEQHRQHVPYRNSMMTSVLRDSLGGNCMTSMIAAVSTDRVNVMETISTCRFAQRVALIKNDAVLNEELDPQVLIARLRQENDLLRAELAKLSGEPPDGELSPEDRERVERALVAFLEERSVDAAPSGDIIADSRKVIYFCQCLKRKLTEKGPVIQQAESVQSSRSEMQSGNNQNNDDWQHPAYTKELKELQGCLLQRDNEINILVNMLKKEKRRAAEAISRAAGAPARHPLDSLPPPAPLTPIATMSHPMDATEQRTKERVLGKLSLGREEAYELFKRDFDKDNKIEEAKQALRERCTEAKAIGQQMIESRNASNRLAESIKKHRLHRALGRQNGSSVAADEDQDADSPMDHEEGVMRAELGEATRIFKTSVRRLKELKAEIEHRKHLIESMNIRLVQAFQKWWAEQEREQMASKGLMGPPASPQQPAQAWQTPPLTPARRSSAGAPLPDIPPARELSGRPPSSRGLSTASSATSLTSASAFTTPDRLPVGTSGYSSGISSAGPLNNSSYSLAASGTSAPSPARRPPSGGVPEMGGTSTGDPTLDAAISSFFSDRRRAKELRGAPNS